MRGRSLSRRREQLLVLPPPQAAPAEPGEQGEQGERADDARARRGRPSPRAARISTGAVERVVASVTARPGRPRTADVCRVSWIVAYRASAFTWARATRTCASSLRAASRRASSVARVSASRSVPASRAERRAICSRSAVSRFVSSSTWPCRSSICTCCETILPSPERRTIASCTFAVGTFRVSDETPGVRRRVRHGDEVAAEVARDPQRLLRRVGERVDVLHRQRQLGRVALRPAGASAPATAASEAGGAPP